MSDTTSNLASLMPTMVSVAGGSITLRDEGTGREWDVSVKPFEIAHVPVTRRLLEQFVPAVGDRRPATPATEVSWNDAVGLCNQLSAAIGLSPCYSRLGDPEATDVSCDFDAGGFRLPTEAEWELACRAGSEEPRYGELDAIAWYAGNSGDELHDVATREPNGLGLYDMLGNAWEWCWDVFDPRVYGGYRVFRGGGFADPPRGCRASCRRKSHPTFAIDDLGFRLTRSA